MQSMLTAAPMMSDGTGATSEPIVHRRRMVTRSMMKARNRKLADSSSDDSSADEENLVGMHPGVGADSSNTEVEKLHKEGIKKDIPNILLLTFLYMLQGIPAGLAFGSIPFLLQDKITYTQQGIFSFAQYPYSLKLLWSPFVDSYFSDRIGRRKSWIIPTQLLIALVMWLAAGEVEHIFSADSLNVYYFTGIFFVLVFLCATQDIAVDGWALTLLSEGNKSYQSTCQGIGLNTGFFLSYTIFLALNSASFCNSYLRSVPQDEGIFTLPSYLRFWAIAYVVMTVIVYAFKKEEKFVPGPEEDLSLPSVYMKMWKMVKIPHLRMLVVILLISKIAFSANDAVTSIKLVEYGFPKESLAVMVTVSFPFEFVFAVVAGRMARGKQPMKPFLVGYMARMLLTVLSGCMVYSYKMISDAHEISYSVYGGIMLIMLGYSLSVNFMFVSQCAFFARISDESIGGTYMTLLNTVANLGGTWPKFFVFWLVDKLSTDALDGYYPTTALCIVVGLLIYPLMNSSISRMQNLSKRAWKVPS